MKKKSSKISSNVQHNSYTRQSRSSNDIVIISPELNIRHRYPIRSYTMFVYFAVDYLLFPVIQIVFYQLQFLLVFLSILELQYGAVIYMWKVCIRSYKYKDRKPSLATYFHISITSVRSFSKCFKSRHYEFEKLMNNMIKGYVFLRM